MGHSKFEANITIGSSPSRSGGGGSVQFGVIIATVLVMDRSTTKKFETLDRYVWSYGVFHHVFCLFCFNDIYLIYIYMYINISPGFSSQLKTSETSTVAFFSNLGLAGIRGPALRLLMAMVPKDNLQDLILGLSVWPGPGQGI